LIKLLDILKEMTDTVKCKNCGWEWKLSDGGKDPYVCHKCKYNNKTNKFTESLKEMGLNDWGVQNIIDAYKRNANKAREISVAFAGQTEAPIDSILDIIQGMDKADFDEKLKSVGLHNLEEACWDGYRQDGMKKKGDKMVPNCVRMSEAKKKKKINPAYLTKDAAAMRKEIDRVKKLKSDDPSAYGKWEADYADKEKTKKYKTKKSAATSAYEKRFGKKEK
jgi:hypothetical protein